MSMPEGLVASCDDSGINFSAELSEGKSKAVMSAENMVSHEIEQVITSKEDETELFETRSDRESLGGKFIDTLNEKPSFTIDHPGKYSVPSEESVTDSTNVEEMKERSCTEEKEIGLSILSREHQHSLCPHVVKSVDLKKLTKEMKKLKLSSCDDCERFRASITGKGNRKGGSSKARVKGASKLKTRTGRSDNGENVRGILWLCLCCGKVACSDGFGDEVESESGLAHMKQHISQLQKHVLVMQVSSLEVWCTKCNCKVEYGPAEGETLPSTQDPGVSTRLDCKHEVIAHAMMAEDDRSDENWHQIADEGLRSSEVAGSAERSQGEEILAGEPHAKLEQPSSLDASVHTEKKVELQRKILQDCALLVKERHQKLLAEATVALNNSKASKSLSSSTDGDNQGSSPRPDPSDRGENDACQSVEEDTDSTGSGQLPATRRILGLQNLGNTCFFNAVMQNLVSLEVLRLHFLPSHETTPSPDAASWHAEVPVKGALTQSLKKFYAETSASPPKAPAKKTGDDAISGSSRGYKSTTRSGGSGFKKGKGGGSVGKHSSLDWENSTVYNPRGIFGAICAKNPRFKGFQQQDSHELLRCLLDLLQDEEEQARLAVENTGHLQQQTAFAAQKQLLGTPPSTVSPAIQSPASALPSPSSGFRGGESEGSGLKKEALAKDRSAEESCETLLDNEQSPRGTASGCRLSHSQEEPPGCCELKGGSRLGSGPTGGASVPGAAGTAEVYPTKGYSESIGDRDKVVVTPGTEETSRPASTLEALEADNGNCNATPQEAKSPIDLARASGGKNFTLVNVVFGGQLSSIVTCCTCGHSSEVLEPFLDLSLPIATSAGKGGGAAQVRSATSLTAKKAGKFAGPSGSKMILREKQDLADSVATLGSPLSTSANSRDPQAPQDVQSREVSTFENECSGESGSKQEVPSSSDLIVGNTGKSPSEALAVISELRVGDAQEKEETNGTAQPTTSFVEEPEDACEDSWMKFLGGSSEDGISDDQASEVEGATVETANGAGLENEHAEAAAKPTQKVPAGNESITAAPQGTGGKQLSVENCLLEFTQAELLTGENAWACDKCSRQVAGEDDSARSDVNAPEVAGPEPDASGSETAGSALTPERLLLGAGTQAREPRGRHTKGPAMKGGIRARTTGKLDVDESAARPDSMGPGKLQQGALSSDHVGAELADKDSGEVGGENRPDCANAEQNDLPVSSGVGPEELEVSMQNLVLTSRAVNSNFAVEGIELDGHEGNAEAGIRSNHHAGDQNGGCEKDLSVSVSSTMLDALETQQRAFLHGATNPSQSRHQSPCSPPPEAVEHLPLNGGSTALHDAKQNRTGVEVTANKGRGGSKRFSKQQVTAEKAGLANGKTDSKAVRRDATKQLSIFQAPKVLTVHLKRFKQDMRGRLNKINGHVEFSDWLDMGPYIDKRNRSGSQRVMYCLTGVVEHSGTLRGGHYVAYVRGGLPPRGPGMEEAGSSDSSQAWYYITDSHVQRSSLGQVLKCEAYILFYVRV